VSGGTVKGVEELKNNVTMLFRIKMLVIVTVWPPMFNCKFPFESTTNWSWLNVALADHADGLSSHL
jgi:hypothetical protein